MEKLQLLKELVENADREKWKPADPATQSRKRAQVERDDLFVPIQKLQVVSEGVLRARAPRPPVNSPQKALALFREYFKGADREMVAVMPMNTANEYLSITTVAIGTINHVEVHPAEVFKVVLAKDNAAQFVIGHNHPSGKAEPSDDDFALLEDLRRLGLMLDRPMRDFIVVGNGTDEYYSHRELHYDV